MTETEFIEEALKLFTAVEDAVDASDWDMDASRSGNVLTLEADSGEQIVINQHVPTQQMWLATRAGGLHFSLEDGVWKNTRGGKDFWEALGEAICFVLGRPVEISRQLRS